MTFAEAIAALHRAAPAILATLASEEAYSVEMEARLDVAEKRIAAAVAKIDAHLAMDMEVWPDKQVLELRDTLAPPKEPTP